MGISEAFNSGDGIAADAAKLVDTYPLGDDDRQRLRLELEALLHRRDAAAANQGGDGGTRERLLLAELSQGDSYTKRARPTVVYVGLAFIFFNYCLVPALTLASGGTPTLLELPNDFWWAWGGIVATWSVGRSFEKVGVSNRITRTITGSAEPAPRDADTASG